MSQFTVDFGDTVNSGIYLHKTFAPFYKVIKAFGEYRVYHKVDGYLMAVTTQRKARNVMRAYDARKEITEDGRE